MYLEPTQPRAGFIDHQKSLLPPAAHIARTSQDSTQAGVPTPGTATAMERNTSDYPPSGLPSPYPPPYTDGRSEGSSGDPQSTSQYPAPQPEVRSNAYSTSATPTSEYGVYPTSARSGSFPEHIQRPYHPHTASNSGSSGGMAQANSPSAPPRMGDSIAHCTKNHWLTIFLRPLHSRPEPHISVQPGAFALRTSWRHHTELPA